jgi:hypothetical protein
VFLFVFTQFITTGLSHFTTGIGLNHATDVFLSPHLISSALDHTKFQLFNDPKQSAYMICTTYGRTSDLHSHLITRSLKASPTYLSGSENVGCFYAHLSVEQKSSLDRDDLNYLTVFEPVPAVMKIDSSIHHYQRSLPTTNPKSVSKIQLTDTHGRESHPILNVISEGTQKVGLTVMFHKDVGLNNQQAAYDQWMQTLTTGDAQSVDGVMEEIFWAVKSAKPDLNRKRRLTTEDSNSNQQINRLPYIRGMKLGRSLSALYTPEEEAEAIFDSQHHKWNTWHKQIKEVLSTQSNIITPQTDTCGYHKMVVTHRKDSLYLVLPEEVLTRNGAYSAADSDAAACFAFLVATVAADPLVDRLALTQSMHTMNNAARANVQVRFVE